MQNSIDISSLLQELLFLSRELLDIYRGEHIQVIEKSDHSPLTIADLHSEQRLEQLLKPSGYPILSEEVECDFDRSQTETFWVVDPLDGTKDFVQKTDEFSIMVGLVENGIPIVGVVCVPAEEKLYYAQKGQGAYMLFENQETRLKVAETSEIKGAHLITSRNHFSDEMKHFSELYDLNLVKCGSNGVKVGRIAEGRADLLFNPTDRMGLWDICGPQVILEEAGGTVTDCQGNPIDYQAEKTNTPFGIAASNGMLHSELIDFTKTC